MKIVADSKILLAQEAFGRFGDVEIVPSGTISRQHLLGADAVIARSDTPLHPLLLHGTPVRFAATATTGIDHVDLAYLHNMGITFASAFGSNAQSVADYFVSALLTLAVERHESLARKSVAVVGYGNVGTRIARICSALGMDVVKIDPPLAEQTGETSFSPFEALYDADIVTLHVPLERSGPYPTFHMFAKEQFGRLKKGAWFFNTSRGAVVDTGALKHHLRSPAAGPAVIDVWEREPVCDDELLELAAIKTPHIAGYSADSKLNATRMIYDAFCRFTGKGYAWNFTDPLPSPAVKEIVIASPATETIESLLLGIVKQCYSVRAETNQYIAALHKNHDTAKVFTTYRAQYPLRREFSATRIRIAGSHTHLAKTLSALGFTVLSST